MQHGSIRVAPDPPAAAKAAGLLPGVATSLREEGCEASLEGIEAVFSRAFSLVLEIDLVPDSLSAPERALASLRRSDPPAEFAPAAKVAAGLPQGGGAATRSVSPGPETRVVAALLLTRADGVPVAWNKRKTLDAARKYAQKGAQEKALKEYAQLLQSDPKDAKLRIEVGDTYRRWGRVDEAIETYTRVAQQYTQEGFDARAVAVYKQIQALDSQRAAIYEPLADLYQRMGLAAEAAQALQTAAEVFQKAGKKREALGALRKLTGLDPANTASRSKVAELLRQEGMTPEAVAEYSAVADELERQRDQEGLAKCLQRLIELAPERADILARLSRCLLELGRSAEAESFGRRALAANPADPALYEMLADLYRRLGRTADVEEIYRSLANFHRERGDTDRARDILQRLVTLDGSDEIDAAVSGEFSETRPEEAVGVADGDPSVFGSPSAFDAAPGLDDEPLLLVEPGVSGEDDLFEGELGSESLFEDDDGNGATQLTAPTRRGGEAARTPAGESSADLEQLLAEASVYLRYGKRRQALENLEQILRARPDHRPALEKIGEAQVEAGENEAAIASWQRAHELAVAAGEHDAAAVLRDRIRALGGNAAEPGVGLADLPSARRAEPVEAAPAEEEVYLDLDEPSVGAAEVADGFPGLEDAIELESELPRSAIRSRRSPRSRTTSRSRRRRPRRSRSRRPRARARVSRRRSSRISKKPTSTCSRDSSTNPRRSSSASRGSLRTTRACSCASARSRPRADRIRIRLRRGSPRPAVARRRPRRSPRTRSRS